MDPLSVISLTVQIVDGIVKLKNFWSTVQGAPEDIDIMFVDLLHLSELVEEVSEQQDLTPTVVSILKHCQRKITVRSKPYLSQNPFNL